MSQPTISRRDLLRASAVGAAGVGLGLRGGETFAQAPGLVRPGDQPPQKTIRWGIIGTGARSAPHIAAIKTFPHMEIAAACDVDAGRLQQKVARIGGKIETYSDYQKLLANPNLDAVLICTPNFLHKPMLLDALQAGKHVLCEKPMATTLEDGRAMQRAGDASNRVVHYAMQLRYAHRYQELRRMIEAGKIGAPKYLLLAEFRGDWNNRDVWQYTDPKSGRTMNWRYSQVASGGTLNEKCCHYFDILNWMMGGVPQRITGEGGQSVYRDRETWDHANVSLEYPNGAKASLGLCMFGPHRLDLQIIGEEGSLHLPTQNSEVLFQKRGARDAEEIKLTQEIGHGERGPQKGIETAVLRMYEDFSASVRDGKKPFVDAAKALASCQVAFRAQESNARQGEVAWDATG